MDRYEEVKTRVREGIDLVAFIADYTPLKPRGRYHIGLCPFHQEKTPSFTVYSDSQHYKCYGCGEAGDVFSFVMKRDGLGFREVLEMLADRLGISTEGVFQRGRGEGRREDVHGTLARVRDWFHEELHEDCGAAAREYLQSRGLDAAIESFGLGFHPPGGRLDAFVTRAKLARGVVEQAGLLGTDGYERFGGRLMFPIVDERGRVTGFGGRVLQADAERAKYLNSPESPFFNKRRLLFGLDQVKKSGDRQLVVMEGYTDVIAAQLAGFTGAVATLGTALTTDHARLLERYATGGVVLLFDGDRAGRQAADRAFRELVHTRLPVSIALLDEGVDPADLVSDVPGKDPESVARGREQLQAILAGADDALTVWFRLIRQRLDLSLDVHVERTAAECRGILAGLQDPVRRVALGRRMASHLGVPEDVFLRTVSPARTGRRGGPAAPRRAPVAEADAFAAMPGPAAGAPQGAEGDAGTAAPQGESRASPSQVVDPRLVDSDLVLIACLLLEPERVEAAMALELALPAAQELRDLVREGVAKGSHGNEQIVGYLFMRCAERPDLSRHLASCLDRAVHIKSPADSLSLLLQDRSAHDRRNQAQNIRYRLQQARAQGDHALADALTQEYLEQLRSRSVGGP